MQTNLELMKELSIKSPSKIVMLVIDGLGGLPDKSGKTELESAATPNMDRLAEKGMCGLVQTVAAGITPGSAPGHLGLFGYNPLEYIIGRGVLEALGTGFEMLPGDIAARGNFCTLDAKGYICDRRAGRIASEKGAELCRLLNGITINGVQVIVKSVKDHRLFVIFRGAQLDERVTDSDPQRTGVAPNNVSARDHSAVKTAELINKFLSIARETLSPHSPANMILLRGFSCLPNFPLFPEVFGLRSAAIAAYPMYRGLAKVIGMDVLDCGTTLQEEIATLEQNYQNYDFFFLHAKGADAAGEDGDFARKVKSIEEVDTLLPRICGLCPEVLIITGDHSTPATLSAHSWHPVPCILSAQHIRPDGITKFSEASCRYGGMGHINSTALMWLAMAHGLKLNKFGA